MIIKQRRHNITDEPYLENIMAKKKYRRVVGGIGWPSSSSPGFVLMLGEDLYAGDKFKIRDLHLITEAESQTPADLLSEMSMLQGVYTKVDWYGDTENPGMVFLSKKNKELLLKREPRITIRRPPKQDVCGSFGLYAQLIKKRIGQEKTLYFDNCKKIANSVLGVVDIDKFKEGDSPGFAALMYAVAAIEMKDVMPQTEEKKNRIGDRVGGY